MLLATLIIASFSIYHIIVHAFFKSLLFLLAAELIHINQANFQSIYSFKINSSLIYAYFLCSGSALIFSISKEGILHSSIILFDSFLIFHFTLLGAFYTIFYLLTLFSFIFSFFNIDTI
jgi:NADH:ubiquinone oxidoreductase subunit 5 (subunit L)/multisubunit Na+/H+ antiporter MnhA subunit